MNISKINLNQPNSQLYYSYNKIVSMNQTISHDRKFSMQKIPIATFKAYNFNNNYNYNDKIKISEFNIVITNNEIEPFIELERITEPKILSNDENLNKIYEVAYNNQISTSNYKKRDCEITNRIAYAKYYPREKDFLNFLDNVKNDFIPMKLQNKFINEAINEHKERTTNITAKDILDYNENILKNSKYMLTISVNKNFYDNNREIFEDILNKNFIFD